MNVKKTLILMTGLVIALAASGCTRQGVEPPTPVGPSTLATVLKVTANPNVLNAGTQRAGTTIKASFMKYDGTPLSGRTVTFEVNDASDMRSNIGYFEGRKSVVTRLTDGGGNAYVTYLAPLRTEVHMNCVVHIWGTVAGEGSTFVQDYAEVYIIR